MRVLFVMTGADTGGAERLVAMLGRNWPSKDVCRLVVLLGRGTLSDELEASFPEVTYVDIDPSSRRLDRMVAGLEREIERFKPDVVSSHMFHADLVVALARAKDVAKVTTVHTQAFGPKDLLLTKAIARAVGLLSWRFDAVVPTSDSAPMKAFLRRLHMRHVVPAIPNATEIPEKATFDSTSRALVSLARNHPVKGHHTLMEAFSLVSPSHPDWRLRLVGPGVEAEQEPFASLIRDASITALLRDGRITLEGATSRPADLVDSAAGLVISSQYGETMPLVGLEAASRGVPVITTDVGSCSSFVDDPRFLVTPASVPDLARALDAYLGLTDDARIDLSIRARERAEANYGAAAAAARHRAVHQQAVQRHGA